MNSVILVYTPGSEALAQPTPQLTRPINVDRPFTFKVSGLPESPYLRERKQ